MIISFDVKCVIPEIIVQFLINFKERCVTFIMVYYKNRFNFLNKLESKQLHKCVAFVKLKFYQLELA